MGAPPGGHGGAEKISWVDCPFKMSGSWSLEVIDGVKGFGPRGQK